MRDTFWVGVPWLVDRDYRMEIARNARTRVEPWLRESMEQNRSTLHVVFFMDTFAENLLELGSIIQMLHDTNNIKFDMNIEFSRGDPMNLSLLSPLKKLVMLPTTRLTMDGLQQNFTEEQCHEVLSQLRASPTFQNLELCVRWRISPSIIVDFVIESKFSGKLSFSPAWDLSEQHVCDDCIVRLFRESHVKALNLDGLESNYPHAPADFCAHVRSALLSNKRLRDLKLFTVSLDFLVAVFEAFTENFAVERLSINLPPSLDRTYELIVQNMSRCLPYMKGLKVLTTTDGKIRTPPVEISRALVSNTSVIDWTHNGYYPNHVDIPAAARNALRRNRLLAGAQATTEMDSAQEFSGLVSLLGTNKMDVSGCAMYTLIRQFFPKFCRPSRNTDSH